MYQKTGNTFSARKKRGKKFVPPVVRLRHAKVVVSRQYPRKKPVRGMYSSRYRIVFLGLFFLAKALWRNIGGVLCCCCGP